MGRGDEDEFALEGGESVESATRDASRRRGVRGPGGSPWLWVTAAVALIAAGVAVSPGGERPAPRPPATAWTVQITEGRAPQVWAIEDQALVTTAAGVTAFDAATGDEVWSVPLADPSCTEADGELTCVHGEDQDATIAIVTAHGQTTEHVSPFANVAVAVGDALLVAGGTSSVHPWVDRYDPGETERTWRARLDYPLGEGRWARAILSQGVATFYTPMTDPETFVPMMAVDASTGELRPVVIPTPRGYLVGMNADVERNLDQLLPAAGPGLDLPEHPDAVLTTEGVLTAPEGDAVYSNGGSTVVAALRTDLLEWVFIPPEGPWEPSSPPDNLPGTFRRVDVTTGESIWSTPTESLVGCPCTINDTTAALITSNWSEAEAQFGVESIHGFDLDTGDAEWSIPLSRAPEAIASDDRHFYVLIDGAVTAYADR
ncbi:PQQ-binding-like beta-propeller repeat protein [Ruania rhizosphaerae]|uniref:PQQ-binding-like beta-propeller repeat protein n=1 Tax=Ruania rhizosphaerae TaxID=1840413 RepID=UPI00135AFB54|nr:PQQ-binding-like beta-propeller repeat protein [Ruania rhizosphaerae]